MLTLGICQLLNRIQALLNQRRVSQRVCDPGAQQAAPKHRHGVVQQPQQRPMLRARVAVVQDL